MKSLKGSETSALKSPIIRKCSYLSLKASNCFWSCRRWFSIKDLLGLYVQQSNHFLLLIFISIKIASISDGRFSIFNNFEVILFWNTLKSHHHERFYHGGKAWRTHQSWIVKVEVIGRSMLFKLLPDHY